MEAVRKELEEKYPNVQVPSPCINHDFHIISIRRQVHLLCNHFQIDVVVFDMGATMGEQPNSLTRIRSIIPPPHQNYYHNHEKLTKHNYQREVCNEITDKRDVSLLFHFAGITDVIMIIISFLLFPFISIMMTMRMMIMMTMIMVNDCIMTRWAAILTCLLPSYVTSLRSSQQLSSS